MSEKKTQRKRGGLGTNPLDALVPVQAGGQSKRRGLAPAGSTPPKPQKPAKDRYTLHLPVELMERAKNAAYWTPGLTLTALAEAGIRAAVENIEKKHGGAFESRERELVGGRPLKEG